MVGLIFPEQRNFSIRARGMIIVRQDASTVCQAHRSVLGTLVIKGMTSRSRSCLPLPTC